MKNYNYGVADPNAKLNELMDDLNIEDCYSASCRCRDLATFCKASLAAINEGCAEFDDIGCANLEKAIDLLEEAAHLILTADEYYRR